MNVQTAYLVLLLVLGSSAVVQKSVLYLWSGQNTNVQNAADFVSVIDYDVSSPSYGKILKNVHLRNSSTVKPSSNEAHHAGVSSDRKWYVTGGLLSFLQGSSQVFVWSIPSANPADGPVFKYDINPPGGCTDEFFSLPEPYSSSFVFTQMCSSSAGSPGELVFLDAATGSFYPLLNTSSPDFALFNPHGVSYSPLTKTLMATDFIVPYTLLAKTPADLLYRDTLHSFYYDPAQGKASMGKVYTQKVTPPNLSQLGTGNGFLDFKFIPGDAKGRGYTEGNNDAQLYLVDTSAGTMTAVFNLLSVVDGFMPSAIMIDITADGQRLLISFQQRYVLLFNISTPTQPLLLQKFDFCTDPALANYALYQYGANASTTYAQFCKTNPLIGSHYLKLSRFAGDDRFTVINYFLVFGLAKFGGTRTVHSFTFNPDYNSFSLDMKFDPNPQLAQLGASPHATAYIPLNADGSVYTAPTSAPSTSAPSPSPSPTSTPTPTPTSAPCSSNSQTVININFAGMLMR